MCFQCIENWKREHAEAMQTANEHMDSLGIPEDSIARGYASIQLACNANPLLGSLMQEMYSRIEQLVS